MNFATHNKIMALEEKVAELEARLKRLEEALGEPREPAKAKKERHVA